MDREEFENWLEQQTQETCVKIATRAALRVFPIVTHFTGNDDRLIQLALLTARAILTAGVAGTMPTPAVRDAAAFAAGAADAADTAAAFAAGAANAAAFAAGAADAADAAACAAGAATFAADAAAFAAGAALDAAYADMEINPVILLQTPIWLEPRESDLLFSALDGKLNLLDSGPEWAFWHEWYQGYLDGKPLDWALQKEIALIGQADWEKGPAWIAGLIKEIQARFELEQRILELENTPVTFVGSRRGIGGNNPPETLQHVAQVSKELFVIWDPLLDLKAEAASETPDKSKILNLITAITEALKTGLGWCASKADLAVDTTIKWGIPAAGGYFVLNPDKLVAVIEAAKTWAGLIP